MTTTGSAPIILTKDKQEAQLSPTDRATLYVSEFMLCFTRYGS